jgi:hypothetical protein
MTPTAPENNALFRFIEARGEAVAISRPADPTQLEGEYGAHPEIVEHMWIKLHPVLPVDCRFLVGTRPSLVCPNSGVVLVLGLGTKYLLHLPSALANYPNAAGAMTYTRWSMNKGDMDTQKDIGPEWVFGRFEPRENAWLLAAYQKYELPSNTPA